jgi:hypothetical protein
MPDQRADSVRRIHAASNDNNPMFSIIIFYYEKISCYG